MPTCPWPADPSSRNKLKIGIKGDALSMTFKSPTSGNAGQLRPPRLTVYVMQPRQ